MSGMMLIRSRKEIIFLLKFQISRFVLNQSPSESEANNAIVVVHVRDAPLLKKQKASVATSFLQKMTPNFIPNL